MLYDCVINGFITDKFSDRLGTNFTGKIDNGIDNNIMAGVARDPLDKRTVNFDVINIQFQYIFKV